MKKKVFFSMFLFVVQIILAQSENRLFKKIIESKDYVTVKVSDGEYRIQFYSSEIVETSFIPKGEEFNNNSYAVISKPKTIETLIENNPSNVLFSSDKITVSINKTPFQISYSYKGKPIISEKEGYSKIDSGESIQFNIEEKEVLYGGGARALGMNRRGNRLQLYNKAHYGYETHSKLMNYTMPLVLSSKMYAIHFDNAPIGWLDLDSKKDNTLTYETISGRKTYQVIVGDSWLDLIDSYTSLTGKQPMPPRWALGNFASRFGYHSEEETRKTVEQFRRDSIPLDAVILDLYWFGKEIQGTMGNLEFHKDSFPTPKKMIQDFSKEGVKTVLITEPFVLSTSKRWEDAIEKDILAKDSIGKPFVYDFYFGNTGLIDIYNPKGKEWFWNVYKNLHSLGVKGIWGDLGEPEVHPKGLLHAIGTADELHNVYGHHWAQLIAEGYKKNFPEERPFILMRAGHSGSQRFGMIPWSGDVNRTWGGLQSQPEIALQMGMQGIGYMHSDLGGFAGDLDDEELYVRWLQYGVFQPIYRPHGQESVAPEPIYKNEKTKRLAKQAIELRYQLLPYNYTLVYKNNQYGTPLMTPLFFEEPSNIDLYDNADTYLWGKDILVSPIIEPKIKSKEVYFPVTDNWYDLYTGEKIKGGDTKTVKLREENIPTYIRAGAFIPMIPVIQSTKEYSLKKFKVHYYHDDTINTSSREIYNDNGETSQAFEKGEYELLLLKSFYEKKNLKINFKAEIGENYISSIKKIEIIIHNIKNDPKRVRVKGKKVKYSYEEKNKTLSFFVTWEVMSELKMNIKL
ncbi:TIM-barrel domain-containing protein [uncultured Maribacter sp.]|uniref:TIM-barrel domain-containing protein n=1 Tax=uncultured Maribacter sp. TaxID=431308 RepID=UPI002622A08E|nr:TIM-barrel domain-containing protein [uncultured Maribacter sp.]